MLVLRLEQDSIGEGEYLIKASVEQAGQCVVGGARCDARCDVGGQWALQCAWRWRVAMAVTLKRALINR